MLIVFMFHKVSEPTTLVEKFERFLIQLKSNYNLVLPGDKLSLFKQSICLTFDDAYFDFYYYVFPLLKKYQIKAVLAVPTAFILDHTDIKPKERFNITQKEAMTDKTYQKAPFCTWQELKEMADSGFVEIASHHHHHISSKDQNFDAEKEMIYSKKILEEKLQKPIKTLIYPYGHFSKEQHQIAKEFYPFIMRIGYAINFSWGKRRQLIYRVNADPFWKKDEKLNFKKNIAWFFKYLSNRIRKV